MPDIHHEIFIAASAEKVYEALTSQSGLAAWWTPVTSAKAEAGTFARFEFGSGYFKEMKIEALRSAEYVGWTCVSGAEEWIGTSISFRLYEGVKNTLKNTHAELTDQLQQSASQNGTVLVFCHSKWKEHTAMFAECNYTWAQFLRSLKRLCETGRGCPWPMQHGND